MAFDFCSLQIQFTGHSGNTWETVNNGKEMLCGPACVETEALPE